MSTILTAVGIGAFFILLMIQQTIHQVDEGHVGIYWRGGALLKQYSLPGFNFKFPIITYFEQVQISVQTDRVVNIPCGTSSGVVIYFESVEAVNRLKTDFIYDTIRQYGVDYDKIWIFDKIHHEINQFCSQHTLREVYIDKFDQLDERLGIILQESMDEQNTGIEIIAMRVTKPRIPKSIRSNYELMEAERTKLLVTAQHKKVVEKMAETQRKKELIMAKQLQAVSNIEMETELLVKKAYQTMEALENQIQTAKNKAVADAEYYKMTKMATANTLKLTKPYLKLELYRAIEAQPKFFFGDLNNMFNTSLGNDITWEESVLKEPTLEDLVPEEPAEEEIAVDFIEVEPAAELLEELYTE